MFIKALLMSLLTVSSTVADVDNVQLRQPPSVNLSAIHLLDCMSPTEGEYTGTGWLIGPNIVATANHVAAAGRCFDVNTHTMLMPYVLDAKHDFALMTGPEPKDEPYIQYTCVRPTPNHIYQAYGITSFGFDWGHNIFRNNVVVATKEMTTDDNLIEDFHSKGMRVYNGYTVPGMSGGPVIDPLTGYAYALVNAGDEESSLLYDLADTPLCTNTHLHLDLKAS